MTDSTASDLDVQARAVLAAWGQPKRRARSRVSRALHDAEECEVATSGGPVAAWRLGAGPAALLVHGWEDDNALWGPLIDQFARIGKAVVALDLPGHGFTRSDDASPRGVGEAVMETAKALGPIDAIVCHSYGCTAGMVAMVKGLKVDRAVMIASPVPRTRERGEPRREVDASPEVVARALEMRAQGEEERREQVERMLAGMAAKVLVVHSIDDEQCPMQNAERMAELWPGAELLLVDGLGHRFVAQDAQVLERVVDFVEGL